MEGRQQSDPVVSVRRCCVDGSYDRSSECPQSLLMMFSPDSTSKVPATRIALKVVPGSRRAQIVGALGDRLKVKVAAAPEDGKANKAVCELLAEALKISVRDVSIIAGHSNPEKIALVVGLGPDEVEARLL